MRRSIDAVVIVDMQKEFLSSFPGWEVEVMIKAQMNVLEACRYHEVPAAVLEMEECSKTEERIRDSVLSLDRYVFIEKSYSNGFIKTNLDNVLCDWDTDQIYLMGGYANACVQDTAAGALDLGIKVATSEDICFDSGYFKDDAIKWFLDNGNCYHHHSSVIKKIAQARQKDVSRLEIA